MPKLDLHTHSIASADGGLAMPHYKKALETGLLDCIAITDHNRIDYALLAQAEIGDQIIVGEEIMTQKGEIIGLYLKEPVPPELSLSEAVARIKEQGGLVYIPHPFEIVRKGLHPADLESIEGLIDVIEVCNGRAMSQNRASQAVVWAKLNHVIGAASSDAHGFRGLGKTYTTVQAIPTKDSLVTLLKSGVPTTDRPSLRALLYPKYNRLRKKFKKDVY